MPSPSEPPEGRRATDPGPVRCRPSVTNRPPSRGPLGAVNIGGLWLVFLGWFLLSRRRPGRAVPAQGGVRRNPGARRDDPRPGDRTRLVHRQGIPRGGRAPPPPLRIAHQEPPRRASSWPPWQGSRWSAWQGSRRSPATGGPPPASLRSRARWPRRSGSPRRRSAHQGSVPAQPGGHDRFLDDDWTDLMEVTVTQGVELAGRRLGDLQCRTPPWRPGDRAPMASR
jgi:hypothetical protein